MKVSNSGKRAGRQSSRAAAHQMSAAGRPRSMHRCSTGCGNGRIAQIERPLASQGPALASPTRGAVKPAQLRHGAPPASAVPRRRPGHATQHSRRRGDPPATPCASASADFSAADIVSPSAAASSAVAPVSPLPALPRKQLSGLAARVVFGVLLGLSGAVVIISGGKVYMGIACLVAYQASQEYFGFLTSKVRI